MKTFGIILLLLGLIFIILSGFQISSNELVNIDARQISNPDVVSIYWSPITAIALISAGLMILIIVKKERKVLHR